MRHTFLATLAVAFLFLPSCASSADPAAFVSYRACLTQVRGGRQLFDTGRVINKDADGRLLFRYDDTAWGDPKTHADWIAAEDASRHVRRCDAAGGFPRASEGGLP